MQKGKIIQKIIGPWAKQEGFQYQRANNGIWRYARTVNNIVQEFYVQEHRFGKELTLRFETSAYGMGMKDAWKIIPEAEKKQWVEKVPTQMLQGWWKYTTEEEFCQIIEIFKEILICYGLETLRELSIEDEIIPTVEMAEKLYLEHTCLHDSFREKYLSSDNGISPEEMDLWFDIIGKIILSAESTNYESAKPALLEIAGFIGDELIRYAGGQWVHPKGSRVTFISGLNCYIWNGLQILGYVVEMYKLKNTRRLNGFCNLIYSGKLPLTEEEMLLFQKREREILN